MEIPAMVASTPARLIAANEFFWNLMVFFSRLASALRFCSVATFFGLTGLRSRHLRHQLAAHEHFRMPCKEGVSVMTHPLSMRDREALWKALRSCELSSAFTRRTCSVAIRRKRR